MILKSAPLEKVNEVDANSTTPLNLKIIIPVVVILAAAAAAVASGQFGTFDFTQIIEQSASKIENMGPYGYVYFALVRAKDFDFFLCSDIFCIRNVMGMNLSSPILIRTL